MASFKSVTPKRTNTNNNNNNNAKKNTSTTSTSTQHHKNHASSFCASILSSIQKLPVHHEHQEDLLSISKKSQSVQQQHDFHFPMVNAIQLFDNLKMMEQYKKVLGSTITKLVHRTISPHLQWLAKLHTPISIPEDLQKPYYDQIQTWQKLHGEMTFLESAFEIQKITPVRDPLFT